MRRPWPGRRQAGVAAIELALIMLFFMGLLPVVLMFGRALLAYTVVQKSAHDAARYMASLPLPQMSNVGTATQNAVFAKQMVAETLAETWPGMDTSRIDIACMYADDVYNCGTYASRPQQVRVKFAVDMPIDFLPIMLRIWLPDLSSIPLRANATVRYDN